MKPRPAELTAEQLEDVRRKLAQGVPPDAIVVTRTKASRKGAKRGEMNGLESQFAQRLEDLKQIKAIRSWSYESVKFRIAFGEKPCWFTPDFVVVDRMGEIACYETKGWWREAARLRIKVAAGVVTWARFIGVKRIKGEWIFESF